MNTLIGIHCHIVWFGENAEYYYVSFGEYDYDGEPMNDSFGVPDNTIFYYFNKKEAKKLIKAIKNGDPKFQVDDEWYIDLTMGYDWAITP